MKLVKTVLNLKTAPKSWVNGYWLFRVMSNWNRFAIELEQILQIPRSSTLVIQWDLVYNWAPDDDPECESTFQYQPTLFGKVSIVDASTLWEHSRSPLVVAFDHEDWLFHNADNSFTGGPRTPQRIAEDLMVKRWL